MRKATGLLLAEKKFLSSYCLGSEAGEVSRVTESRKEFFGNPVFIFEELVMNFKKPLRIKKRGLPR